MSAGLAGTDPPVTAQGGWRVHLGTVESTTLRLACGRLEDGGPWPLSRALAELARLGLRPEGRFRSLGRGRGTPLLHAQDAVWQDSPVHLESRTDRDGTTEVSLELPSGDELGAATVSEDALWALVDTLAEAVDARFGVLGDGLGLDAVALSERARTARLPDACIGVLLPEDGARPSGLARYHRLDRCGLIIWLR